MPVVRTEIPVFEIGNQQRRRVQQYQLYYTPEAGHQFSLNQLDQIINHIRTRYQTRGSTGELSITGFTDTMPFSSRPYAIGPNPIHLVQMPHRVNGSDGVDVNSNVFEHPDQHLIDHAFIVVTLNH